MKKHTPTPWQVGGHNKCTVYDKFGQRIANSFEGVPVVEKSDGTCAANAEFIVRCVNSHEALVQALMDTQRHLASWDMTECDAYRANAAALAAAGAPQ